MRRPDNDRPSSGLDSATVRAAQLALAGKRPGIRGLLPFVGPAFIASIAYVDPGNFATNIQGGARFGYLLLWVVLASNGIGMFIQVLSAKLGIATRQNLAEVCREQFPRPVVWILWVLSELIAMATDLAEVLGAAVGLQLLFGLPLVVAGMLTTALTFAILGLQRYGFRPLEAVLMALVGVIAACYVVEMVWAAPDWGEAGRHLLIPQFAGPESVLLAVGILGATVMPHVVFLHSHLMQGRIPTLDPVQVRRLFHFERIETIGAMTLAGLINAAMLVMAAATFNLAGHGEVATMETAHETLTPLLGQASSTVFAISLVASGLSASTVGTMAGQVIMQGYLRRTIPIWVRRLVTLLPALVAIWIGLEPTSTLVFSQVVLSFCLPVALVPLVLFTRRPDLMRGLVNHRATTVTAACVVSLIVGLNAFLIVQYLSGA
ncbi:MAG TPA: Nramp family divalent metal transporter [Chloroflexota bacterium]|nr:Nramp family divalent metal transporter [Chloroflexota bacterium]